MSNAKSAHDPTAVIEQAELSAELFTPEEAGPLPAVVVIGGAEEGVPARRIARRVARLGYAAVALASQDVGAAAFDVLLEQLRGRSVVDCLRVGLLGLGAGAEHALRIAAARPEVRAVVAVAPGAGDQVAVEQIAAPILLVAGMEDARWDAVQMADQIIERLATHRFAHGVSLHSYGNAGHWLFGPPMDRSDPLAVRLSQAGGTPEGNAAARLDSWRKTLGFLDDSLKPVRSTPGRPLLIHDDCWIPG